MHDTLAVALPILSTVIIGLIGFALRAQINGLRSEFRASLSDAKVEFFNLVNGKYVSKEVMNLRLANIRCVDCHVNPSSQGD